MTVKDLKELKKLIALCHEQGVESIKVDGIELTLGTKPTRATGVVAGKDMLWKEPSQNFFNPGDIPQPTLGAQDLIQTDGLTDEQMLFYSADPSQESN